MFDLARKSKRILLSLALSVLVILTTFTIAYAAFISIDTNDGGVDTNWPAAPFRNDDSGDASTGYDIIDFWVGTDANPPTQYFFRADLDAAMSGTNPFLEARLDCNNNGIFDEAVDVLVDYVPGADETWVYAGNDINISHPQPATSGEETATAGVYEWKASTSGGPVSWTACLSGTPSIMLVTMEDDTDMDTTEARRIDVVTAVTFQRFDGVSTSRSFLAVTLVSVLLLGGVFAFATRPK